MGAGLSKHEDEVKAENLERAAAASAPKSLSKDDNEAIQTANGSSSESASGCPMKKKDGSYTFDWGAMFRPAFPHGPSGKRPLNEEQVREKVGQPEETTSAKTTAASSEGCPVKHQASEGGCPVKHQEYNVYSQPIDPNNNMPQSANQLRGPGQTKDLPTDRVKSSIGKVRYVRFFVRVMKVVFMKETNILAQDSHFDFLKTTGRSRRRDDVDLSVTTNVLQCLGAQGETRRYRRAGSRKRRGPAQQYE
jgi:hypothetical protein